MALYQIITLSLSLLTAIVTISMFIAIKFNDVKHIQKIEESVTKIQKQVNRMSRKYIKLDVRCKERHKVGKKR